MRAREWQNGIMQTVVVPLLGKPEARSRGLSRQDLDHIVNGVIS